MMHGPINIGFYKIVGNDDRDGEGWQRKKIKLNFTSDGRHDMD